MLGIVMRWHKSKDVFEQECAGYPGFVTKFRVTTADAQGDKDSKDHVDFENYRHVVHKWHFKIAKALVVCLESKDYVQIRNALTILTKILPHFPVIVKLNGVIEKRIEKVCEEEKESRKDLYIKAMSYSGQLKARKHLVMREHEFHQINGPKPDEMKDDETPPIKNPPKKKPSQSRMTPKVRVEVVKVEKNRLHQDTEIQNPKIEIGIVRASPEIGASKKKKKSSPKPNEENLKIKAVKWDHHNRGSR